MKSRLAHRGLTLAEIVFSLGILSFVALTLIGLFSQLVLTSSKSRDLSMAEFIATEILERAAIEGPLTTDNPGGGWGVSGNTGETHPYNLTKPTEYFYRVDVSQLDTSASSPGPGTPVPPGDDNLSLGSHWFLTVRVGWDPNDPTLSSSRTGKGKQWVEAKRNVYYQEWLND